MQRRRALALLTIKPGMTRKTLLSVFTTEGGLSTGLRRTYVSRSPEAVERAF
jgi:hypothetical protein